ncbi:MAG: glutamate--tRNA ligase family protein, partial [Pelagibacteraceae bacterium]
YSYNDLILGKVEIPCQNLEDFSIARSDKKPTFILSNLIDDVDNGITHVIRGNDHSINTIKQNLLSKALDFHEIQYAHIPLIHDLSGKKLSKRDNITNVIDYLNEGYLVQSIFNFIIKLGNNFNDLEFLNKEEAIKNFELNKIVRSPAKFDTQKLNFINNHYLKELSFEEFKKFLDKDLLDRYKSFNFKIIFNEITERSNTTKNFSHEIEKLINTFINKTKIEVDLEEQNLINNIYQVIHNLHDSEMLLETLDKNDLNMKKIGKLMRKILVNFESKLPMDKILLFFGVSNLKERLILFKND